MLHAVRSAITATAELLVIVSWQMYDMLYRHFVIPPYFHFFSHNPRLSNANHAVITHNRRRLSAGNTATWPPYWRLVYRIYCVPGKLYTWVHLGPVRRSSPVYK